MSMCLCACVCLGLACVRARKCVSVREREMGRENAMRCPDCFNPTGNAAVSSVTAERACVRARLKLCVHVCMCV